MAHLRANTKSNLQIPKQTTKTEHGPFACKNQQKIKTKGPWSIWAQKPRKNMENQSKHLKRVMVHSSAKTKQSFKEPLKRTMVHLRAKSIKHFYTLEPEAQTDHGPFENKAKTKQIPKKTNSNGPWSIWAQIPRTTFEKAKHQAQTNHGPLECKTKNPFKQKPTQMDHGPV